MLDLYGTNVPPVPSCVIRLGEIDPLTSLFGWLFMLVNYFEQN